MNSKSIEALELSRLLDIVGRYTVSPLGKHAFEKFAGDPLFREPAGAREALAEVSEAMDWMREAEAHVGHRDERPLPALRRPARRARCADPHGSRGRRARGLGHSSSGRTPREMLGNGRSIADRHNDPPAVGRLRRGPGRISTPAQTARGKDSAQWRTGRRRVAGTGPDSWKDRPTPFVGTAVTREVHRHARKARQLAGTTTSPSATAAWWYPSRRSGNCASKE